MPYPNSNSNLSPQLQHILSTISRLRPLPGNVSRVLQVMDEPGTTSGVIADILALDQALAAYLLRMANSVQYGYSLPCSSLSDAVMRLGFKQVRALVLSTVAAGPLARRLNGYRLGSGVLWQHSIWTSEMVRWLAQALSYPMAEEAYVAGLLHDMGKLLLDQYVHADFNRITETMRKHQLSFWQVEEQLFGIDHAGVGGRMAEQWGFPPALVHAIRCHHAPYLASAHPELAALVHVANACSPEQPSGLSSSRGGEASAEALRILNLNEAGFSRLKAAMFQALSKNPLGQNAPPIKPGAWL